MRLTKPYIASADDDEKGKEENQEFMFLWHITLQPAKCTTFSIGAGGGGDGEEGPHGGRSLRKRDD